MLVSRGFLVSHIDADENKAGVAYTRVWLDDAETKDPTAEVMAFADSVEAPDPIEVIRLKRRAGKPYTQSDIETILDRLIRR